MNGDGVIEAIGKVGQKVDALTQGLILVTDAIGRHTALLSDIHAACTADRPTSPLVEPLRQLAATCQETAAAVRDLTDAVETQPDAMRAVIREELHAREEGE